MPGNETIYKSPRGYLPVVWAYNNVAVNANVVMPAAGLPIGMDQIPVAKAGALTAIIVLLSEPVTTGTLTVTLRKNDVNTTESVAFTSADGTTHVAELSPAAVTLDVGDTVGVHIASSTPFAPAGQIDVVVYMEVQNV